MPAETSDVLPEFPANKKRPRRACQDFREGSGGLGELAGIFNRQAETSAEMKVIIWLIKVQHHTICFLASDMLANICLSV